MANNSENRKERLFWHVLEIIYSLPCSFNMLQWSQGCYFMKCSHDFPCRRVDIFFILLCRRTQRCSPISHKAQLVQMVLYPPEERSWEFGGGGSQGPDEIFLSFLQCIVSDMFFSLLLSSYAYTALLGLFLNHFFHHHLKECEKNYKVYPKNLTRY